MTAINMVFVITRSDRIVVTVSLDMKEMEHGVKVQTLYFIFLAIKHFKIRIFHKRCLISFVMDENLDLQLLVRCTVCLLCGPSL